MTKLKLCNLKIVLHYRGEYMWCGTFLNAHSNVHIILGDISG